MIHPQQNKLLAILDGERQDLGNSGTIRVGGIVREIGSSGDSYIAYSNHAGDELVSALRRETEYFHSIGYDFEWKKYSHDQPQPLAARLRELGFDIESEETVPVAAMELVLQGEDPGHDVRPIATEAGITDYMEVRNQAFAKTSDDYGDWLTGRFREAPESIDLCVAYVDDRPVGSARTGHVQVANSRTTRVHDHHNHDTLPVASIPGGICGG
jgi:hypothetical protein